MIEKTFTTDKPVKVEGIEELARHFLDNEWRELRIYFRRDSTDPDKVEIRYGHQLNIVKLGTN